MRIAISPDEDPGDSGSVAADGTPERAVNLAVCNGLLAALRRCGQDVWFDPTITYVERVTRANADGTELLIACAHDVSTPGVSGGTAVFSPGGQTVGRQTELADAIFAALLADGLTHRRRADTVESIYECWAFDGDTAYIELNCMSPDDQPLWSAPDYGTRAGEAICRAVAGVEGFGYVAPAGAGEEGMTLVIAKRAGDSVDPAGAGAIYLCEGYRGPGGFVPVRRWHIVAPSDENPYLKALGKVEEVDPFLLDHSERGPEIHTGSYPVEQ